MTRVLRILTCLTLLAAPVAAVAQTPQQPPPAQEEFVPLSEIPPEEQIPAFTLVATAYALVWVVLIAYVWSVSSRLHKVEGELSALARRR